MALGTCRRRNCTASFARDPLARQRVAGKRTDGRPRAGGRLNATKSFGPDSGNGTLRLHALRDRRSAFSFMVMGAMEVAAWALGRVPPAFPR